MYPINRHLLSLLSQHLQRLFDEQYIVEDGKTVLRDKKGVKADSIQNPNNPDSTYLAKNDQKVQGYVTDITETVKEDKPNIITSVQVETAVFADCHFLQETVENSELVTDSNIEDLCADGAYQSPDNREFAKNHKTRMVLPSGRLLLATPTRPSKPSQSRASECDGESLGLTKPVGITLKTKTLKPIC